MLPKNLHLHLFIWFWIILSFVFLAFFIILRASGYYLNLKAKTIEKTGLIIISSDPKGASLFLNEKFNQKTPAKLTYLRPGLWEVKLEKENYQTWEKTFKVEAGQVIREKAILFFKNPQIEEFSEPPEFPQKEEVVLDEEILKDLAKPTSLIKNMDWNKNKDILLYQTDYEIWLYYSKKKEKERNKIVARFSRPIQKVVFYPTSLHILFVINNKLRIIETSGNNDIELLDLPVLDFWLKEGGKEIFWKEGQTYKKAKVR